MTLDPVAAAFDAMIAGLDAPLVVVTTASGGERAGCLVGFHSQSGIEPRRARRSWRDRRAAGNQPIQLGLGWL